MTRRGRILVVRGGAIGDFILTLPVFAALRSQFPEAYLEVLGYPQVTPLALAGGQVDAVRSIEARALAGFFARVGQLDPGLQKHFASFHIIISYLYDPDGFFQDNIARCSKAQFLTGPHQPELYPTTHACETLLQPLMRLAIFDPESVPRIRGVTADASAANGRWIAAHPGSGSERKNWPLDRWCELLTRIAQDTDLHIRLIGGEAEGRRLADLAGRLPPDRVGLAQNLPLQTLAGQMSGCRAFVGHDSGITHLAAALGLPGLALWGESNETVWRPRHPGIRVLRDDGGLAALSPDTVFTVLMRLPELA